MLTFILLIGAVSALMTVSTHATKCQVYLFTGNNQDGTGYGPLDVGEYQFGSAFPNDMIKSVKAVSSNGYECAVTLYSSGSSDHEKYDYEYFYIASGATRNFNYDTEADFTREVFSSTGVWTSSKSEISWVSIRSSTHPIPISELQSRNNDNNNYDNYNNYDFSMFGNMNNIDCEVYLYTELDGPYSHADEYGPFTDGFYKYGDDTFPNNQILSIGVNTGSRSDCNIYLYTGNPDVDDVTSIPDMNMYYIDSTNGEEQVIDHTTDPRMTTNGDVWSDSDSHVSYIEIESTRHYSAMPPFYNY